MVGIIAQSYAVIGLCNSYNQKHALLSLESHATVDSQGMVVQSTLLRKFGEYERSNTRSIGAYVHRRSHESIHNLKCAHAKTCLQSFKVFYGILAIDRKHVFKNPTTSIFDKSQKKTREMFTRIFIHFFSSFFFLWKLALNVLSWMPERSFDVFHINLDIEDLGLESNIKAFWGDSLAKPPFGGPIGDLVAIICI